MINQYDVSRENSGEHQFVGKQQHEQHKRPRQKRTEGKERLGFAAADKLRLKILVNDGFDAVSELPWNSPILFSVDPEKPPAGCLVGLNIKANKMRLSNLQISEPNSFSSWDFANPLCMLEKLKVWVVCRTQRLTLSLHYKG